MEAEATLGQEGDCLMKVGNYWALCFVVHVLQEVGNEAVITIEDTPLMMKKTQSIDCM
jgi:hypothetical protein